MNKSDVVSLVSAVVEGLANEVISVRGEMFFYDGCDLLPEDMRDLFLPAIVMRAQQCSQALGYGALGFEFFVRDQPDATQLPFRMTYSGISPVSIPEILAFVAEAFEVHCFSYRNDLGAFVKDVAARNGLFLHSHDEAPVVQAPVVTASIDPQPE